MYNSLIECSLTTVPNRTHASVVQVPCSLCFCIVVKTPHSPFCFAGIQQNKHRINDWNKWFHWGVVDCEANEMANNLPTLVVFDLTRVGNTLPMSQYWGIQ